jgi:hypothetical protein
MLVLLDTRGMRMHTQSYDWLNQPYSCANQDGGKAYKVRDSEGGTFTFDSGDICVCDPSRALHKHHPHVDPRVTEQILLAVKKGKSGANNGTGAMAGGSMSGDSLGLRNGQSAFTGANTNQTSVGGGGQGWRNLSKNGAGGNATYAQGGAGGVVKNGKRGKDKEQDVKFKGWAWEAYEKRQEEIKKKRQEAQDRRERVRFTLCVLAVVWCVCVCMCVCVRALPCTGIVRGRCIHMCMCTCVYVCGYLLIHMHWIHRDTACKIAMAVHVVCIGDMCVCVCVYIYIYIYIYLHTYVHIHTYIHTHTHAHTHTLITAHAHGRLNGKNARRCRDGGCGGESWGQGHGKGSQLCSTSSTKR